MSEPANFEDALAELDRILRALEDGSTSLDEALTRYERGVKLLKECYGQLRTAESRIHQLTPSEDGPPTLAPFAHTAAIEKANAPPKRRTPPSGNGMRGADEGLPF